MTADVVEGLVLVLAAPGVEHLELGDEEAEAAEVLVVEGDEGVADAFFLLEEDLELEDEAGVVALVEEIDEVRDLDVVGVLRVYREVERGREDPAARDLAEAGDDDGGDVGPLQVLLAPSLVALPVARRPRHADPGHVLELAPRPVVQELAVLRRQRPFAVLHQVALRHARVLQHLAEQRAARLELVALTRAFELPPELLDVVLDTRPVHGLPDVLQGSRQLLAHLHPAHQLAHIHHLHHTLRRVLLRYLLLLLHLLLPIRLDVRALPHILLPHRSILPPSSCLRAPKSPGAIS
mmetsp:Transcript_10752/g.34399  ORF Transcript_10752/g.34399 Transcript_10752/m.34399 type:complete len:294 (+) Transcript_10752:495-1376(+)